MTTQEIKKYTESKSREWGVDTYTKHTLLEIRDMIDKLEKETVLDKIKYYENLLQKGVLVINTKMIIKDLKEIISFEKKE